MTQPNWLDMVAVRADNEAVLEWQKASETVDGSCRHHEMPDSMQEITKSAFPPRLHVLLAQRSTYAVVIRRGPSKAACTIGWDRRTDEFTTGQWLHGRIYERRSDLSPDGRYMIYFALNGRWETEVRGSWTAVSRAPYLKAICLWAKGDGWHGGGLFTDINTYWLNDGCGHQLLEDSGEVGRDPRFPGKELYNNECLGVYYNRLQRDGWRLVGKGKRPPDDEVSTFEKRINDCLILRKAAHATVDPPVGRGCYFDEHEIVSTTGVTEKHPDWEWAELDGERVLWAQNGCLYAARAGRETLVAVRQLHDFNGMKFERSKAPY